MPRPPATALRLRSPRHDGATSFRTTEPHRLVRAAHCWYLLAWEVDRHDWRSFRVDRLRLQPLTGPRFLPRDLTDDQAAEHIARGLANATWRYRTRVTVHAPAAQIAGRLPPTITVEPVDPDTCMIDVGSDTAYMLTLYLGMLEADFDIDDSAGPDLTDT